MDTIVEERPLAKEIAEKCSCCPLFLEVVGAYLHKRNNKVEAYEKVVGWLSDGNDFSCDKEDSFEESRILFAYNELTPSAQEATTVERVSIHDLILTAGRHKSKGNRYTIAYDFSIGLENEWDLHKTKGVWLNGIYESSHVCAKALGTMSRSLRVLAMGSDTTVCGQCSKQFDALRFLQAYRVPNLGIDICKIKNLRFMDYTFMENEIWSLPKNFSTLQVLKLRRSWGTFGGDITKRSWGTYGGDTHADIGLGHLINLKHLELHGFHNTQISSFVNVYGLQKLKLSRIEGLKELPGSIRKLRSLQELHLDACSDLMRLGEGFGELSSLTKLGLMSCWALEELPCEFQKLLLLQSLNLWSCSSLVRLPEGLENLPSLKYINVNGCKKLISLPNGICKLSLSENTISFSGISNLKEIPEEICKFTTLTSLSLSFCKSLKVLPIGFGQLSCLEKLYLDGCESLQELCDDFHCLAGLKILSMSGCKSLSRLPEGFGKLGCLERLELSRCDNTQELCSDFGCLRALKYLVLSKCKSLYKLPDCFGQLGCLETLDLSTCSNLEELSSDFHGLTSLISLDLSNCGNLGEKWMDNVGSVQSLWRLNISRSEKMIRRWIEMQREKEDWNFVVLTDCSWDETEDGQKALC
ncbi:hypothetical protein SUGI_0711380 [Cryptomeria japonica]|nr:hypothetical protein SUGI_0711380 [Cryptomeria japonica]